MRSRFGRRWGLRFWRWAPPIGLLIWAVNLYRVASEYALPAFGNVDAYITDYRLIVLRHLPVGVALLCLSVVSLLRSRAFIFQNQSKGQKQIQRRKNSVRSA